jgi:hypothetical protein
MDLRGRWRKETDEPCAAQYPVEIEFKEATYLAAKGPEQGFITWDAGIYRVEPEDRVLVSTATDELVPYQYDEEGERITFTDPGGCQFSYRRVPG